MNNPDHISESLKNSFWVKILKFFDVDPGSGMEKSWIRDNYPGSATLVTCQSSYCITISTILIGKCGFSGRYGKVLWC